MDINIIVHHGSQVHLDTFRPRKKKLLVSSQKKIKKWPGHQGSLFFYSGFLGMIVVVKSRSYLQSYSLNLNETLTHYRQDDYEHFGV